jgi:hypothetical protein
MFYTQFASEALNQCLENIGLEGETKTLADFKFVDECSVQLAVLLRQIAGRHKKVHWQRAVIFSYTFRTNFLL